MLIVTDLMKKLVPLLILNAKVSISADTPLQLGKVSIVCQFFFIQNHRKLRRIIYVTGNLYNLGILYTPRHCIKYLGSLGNL